MLGMTVGLVEDALDELHMKQNDLSMFLDVATARKPIYPRSKEIGQSDAVSCYCSVSINSCA